MYIKNMNILNFNAEGRFKEKEFSAMKETYDLRKTQWLDYTQSQKDYEKQKEAKILGSYLKEYGFIAWYIYKEKNIKNSLLFDVETNQWYAYGHVAPYLWSKINNNMLEIAVGNLLSDIFPFDIYEKYKHPKDLQFLIHEIQQLVSLNLNNVENNNYMVRKNKVFDKKEKKIIENCGPLDYIIQYNTIEYLPNAEAPNIEKWLKFVFNNNEKEIKLFQAICQIILFSNKNYNLNFFVEIRGGGGTGKSLCGRLMQTIVGSNLRTSTNLKKLHTSPYETAGLINKHLVICPDQEAFVSGAEVLKMLTGGDPIRYEIKYKNPAQYFFHGIIVILTNAKLTYGSAESAILRRRITFNFNQTIDSDKIDTDLLNIDNDNNMSGKWYSELPGFMNWILKLSHQDTIKTIKDHLSSERQNVEEFSFMLWIRTYLMPFKEGKIGIIHKKSGPSLYDNYKKFMTDQGYTPVKCPNFESNLEKDFNAAFPGGYTISKQINKHGKTYVGLMYQSANLPEIKNVSDQLTTIALWRQAWQEKYGNNFFGQSTLNTHDQIYIDNEIFDDQELRQELAKNKNTIQKSVGFPKMQDNDTLFNSQTALYFLKQKNIQLTVDKYLILNSFLNHYFFDPENKLLTTSLYEDYQNFIHDQGLNTGFTYKQIKNEIIKAWNKQNPTQIIKSVKNVGKEKLNGIQGLAKKFSEYTE